MSLPRKSFPPQLGAVKSAQPLPPDFPKVQTLNLEAPKLGVVKVTTSLLDGSGAKLLPPPAKPLTQTRHLSLETKSESNDQQSPQNNNRYTIYDLKSVKREILTVFDAAENGDNRAITKFSKTKNFDVDAKDRYGRTALIWAADCGHLHSIETLIRLSANIHAVDSHTGRTALHWAARAGNLPIVKLLAQYGANCERGDRFGQTPLHLAKSIGSVGEEVFQFLLQRMLNRKGRVSFNALRRELLVQYGADYMKDDRFGLTPLYLAKSKGFEGEDVFKYLLGEGAPYNETRSIDLATIEAQIAAEMAKVEAEEAFDPTQSIV